MSELRVALIAEGPTDAIIESAVTREWKRIRRINTQADRFHHEARAAVDVDAR
jgi:hypothetical protein